MSTSKVIFLAVIWGLCTLGGAASAAFIMHVAEHPLARQDPWSKWLVFNVPYLILAASALITLPRIWALVSLLLLTLVTCLLITSASYQDMQISLFLLDAQLAGRHGMSCGPPMAVFCLPFVYASSFGAGVMTLMLLATQAGKGRRKTHGLP